MAESRGFRGGGFSLEGTAESEDQPAVAAGVAESHTAVVVFVGDRAYKVKKPVDFGFLDFTTVESREFACRRELELNRRLAPEAYLDVARVVDGNDRTCEWMVIMRRMPANRRLSALIKQGQDVSGDLERLARILASFHSRAETGPEISEAGSPARLRQRWADNVTGAQPYVGVVLEHDQLVEINRLALQFVEGQSPLLDDRIRRGLIVDGHGDLQADDIFCVPESPQVLDCLEFDPALRSVDVLDDVAFLAMDLERLSAPGLAWRFLDWYQEFSASPMPVSLVHHYLAYRAFVRAKVACLRWAQGVVESASDARYLAGLALEHLRSGQVRVILVGGPPATGKSTIATTLADRLGAVVLRTDQIRREWTSRAGDAGSSGYGQGRYSPDHVHEVYQEMLARAQSLAAHGESVVLDASWNNAAERVSARASAEQVHARITEICCVAPIDVTMARLRNRQDDLSEATVDVAARMEADFAPWPEADSIDTTGSIDSAVTTASGLIYSHQ